MPSSLAKRKPQATTLPPQIVSEWTPKVGDRVTGVPGRVSHGWHGTIKAIEPCKTCPGGFYYRVHFKEREQSTELMRKQPIIGMNRDQFQQFSKSV